MAIEIEKTKLNHSNSIKDNAGFTFILENNSEGFGFIYLAENSAIITVIVKHENGTVDHFSTFVNKYDDITPFNSIKDFLEEYFYCGTTFIKEYKKIEDMNIIVNLEME